MKTQHWFFLRGLVRESGHWDHFLEKFSAVYPHRKAIPLDLAGNGALFGEKSPLTVHGQAERVRAEFLKNKGEENYLFAVSLGAMIGLEWLHSHPADLKGAVLVNTSLRGLSSFHQRLRPQNYLTILKSAMSSDLHFRERKILEMTSNSPEKFDRLEKEWVEIQKARPVSIANATRQLLAAASFLPPKGKPKAKILLLNGAKDNLVSPRCSEEIAKFWKAPLAVHPTAGHDLTLDAPEWALEQIKDF